MNTETKIVKITLGVITKEVEIFRFSENHTWLCQVPVITTFKTGTKKHQVTLTQARENRFGDWSLTCSGFRNANSARVVAWADQVSADSKW